MPPSPRASKLYFVGGKGGVGKTSVSRALALSLARKKIPTLWISIEDPLRPKGEITSERKFLSTLNIGTEGAFEEYLALKTKIRALASLAANNRVVRGLARTAPGVQELVILGKIWFELRNFDAVVVDLPATGHGLALFHSLVGFSKVFTGGAFDDARKMLDTFAEPSVTEFWIVSLPEEMPLRESIEYRDSIQGLFPNQKARLWVNRLFPVSPGIDDIGSPATWSSPIASSLSDFAVKRAALERSNLALWDALKLPYLKLPYLLPGSRSTESLDAKLSVVLEERLR